MLKVPATAAGKKVRCRKCQSVTIVPITTITTEPDSFAQRCVNCGEEFQSTAMEDLCRCCAAALELGKKQQTSDSDDSVPIVSGSSTRHRQLSEGVSSNSDARLSKEESSPPPVELAKEQNPLCSCSDCHAMISKKASKCVHCGAYRPVLTLSPTLRALLLILVVLLFFPIFFVVVGFRAKVEQLKKDAKRLRGLKN